MWTVEASIYLSAPLEETSEHLSPRSIIEYLGIYEITDVTRAGAGWTVKATLEENDIETEFFVEETPRGYAYELIEGGPFDEMNTTVTVDDEVPALAADHFGAEDPSDSGADPDELVRVSISSEYTFGGLLSPIYDWASASSRKKELTMALRRLAEDVDSRESPSETGGGGPTS